MSLTSADLLHRLNVIESELNNLSWWMPHNPTKYITIKGHRDIDENFEFDVLEQIFKAARATLKGRRSDVSALIATPWGE